MWGDVGMHESPASAMLTLNPQRVGPIHLSVYSSNIFYFSEMPSRELGTERCPRHTGRGQGCLAVSTSDSLASAGDQGQTSPLRPHSH